jgi:hypothetical protein
MALEITDSEKRKLFNEVRVQLAAPLRKVELTDEMLCTLAEISIEDYSSYINEWLIESQWSSLYGVNVSNTDLTKAFTTRGQGYEESFTYAYSKIVGLQAGGPWELKKDYITIVEGQQAYSIPAGREINEVLWITPSTLDFALYANYGGGDFGGFGGGFGQIPGGGGSGFGYGGGFYLAPAADILMRDADYDLKQRIISSDLVYKITAGPDGTKILHLLPPPGSRINFGGGGNNTFAGGKVWYHYYETTSDEERQRCLNDNKDIIKLPSDVPVDVVSYSELNSPAKQWVREYLTAKSMEVLGRVRGKFGGALGVTDSEVTMDYESLLSEATSIKDKLFERLTTRLERLQPDKMLEKKANEAESLNKMLGFRPLGHNWDVI